MIYEGDYITYIVNDEKYMGTVRYVGRGFLMVEEDGEYYVVYPDMLPLVYNGQCSED